MADISKIKLPNNSEYLLKDIKALSRGEQLVTNGSGMIGDNTNFSNWIFDGSKANSSAGSFTRTGGYANIWSDDYFPVNANEKYKFEFDMVSQNNTGTMYAMLVFFDVDKIPIAASDTMFYSSTLTTLARELKAGDTKVYLTDASNYKTYGTGSHLRMFTFWDYKNSFGYLYPPETYSRNHIFSAWENDDSIDKTNNVITLASAYTGITRPAGTYVSQGCSGGTYKYSAIIGAKVPTEWTHYTGYFDGTDYSGLNKGATFPPGAAYCKVGFLWNYNSASDQFWVTNISVKEVPQELADEVVLYGGDDTGLGDGTPADNAKAYYLDDDKVQATKPKVFYNHNGVENTIIFSKGSGNGNYGSILKWGQGDNYIRLLRRASGSWVTTDWEKIFAGHSDTSDSAQKLSLSTQVTGSTVNDFRGVFARFAQIKSITIPGLASSDGMIVWIPWSDTYGRQLIFDDTTHKIFSRCYNNGNWSSWDAVAMLNRTDANALMNTLDTGSSTPVDADYYISQYVGGGTTTTTYHRRPVSALWEYIKGKISSVLGLTSAQYGGNAATATNASKVNNHTVESDVPANAKFTDTTYESKAAASGGTAVSLVTTGEKYTWNNKSTVPTNHASTATTYGTGSSSSYGHVKLSESTSSTSGASGGIAATPSAVKTAYDLANTANTTANTALSGVNGNLIYDHTFTISNGVATFTPHVYQKGQEVTTNYAVSCFTWKYRLIDGSEVNLTTNSNRGCTVTISGMGYGGHVIGIFTPPS